MQRAVRITALQHRVAERDVAQQPQPTPLNTLALTSATRDYDLRSSGWHGCGWHGCPTNGGYETNH